MYCDVLKNPIFTLVVALFCHGCSFFWDPYARIACSEPSHCPADGYRCYQGECRKVKKGCGDFVVEGDEACDEGVNNSDSVADACRTTCVAASCGDGVVDTGETCDDGDDNSDTRADACRTTCVAASCGDGVVDTGETCDEGVNNSDSVVDACRTTCVVASCGDGVVDDGESCDGSSHQTLGQCTNECFYNTLAWTGDARILGSQHDDKVNDIWADQEKVFVAGYFCDNWDGGDSCSMQVLTKALTSVGFGDGFVLQIDSSASLMASLQLHSSAEDAVHRLVELGTSEFYALTHFCGGSTSTCVLSYEFLSEGSTPLLTSVGDQDLALVPLARDGLSPDTAGIIHLGSDGFDRFGDVSVYPDGSMVVVGAFTCAQDNCFGQRNSSSELLAETPAVQSAGGEDAFVARFDSSGGLYSLEVYGGVHGDWAREVEALPDGGFLLAGQFCQGADIDCSVNFGVGASCNLQSQGKLDIFVARYNSDGVCQWVQGFGSEKRDSVKSLILDASENVYLLGQYCQNGVFGNCSLSVADKTWDTLGDQDGFLAKLSISDGSVLWLHTMRSVDDEVLNGVSIGPEDRVKIAGSFCEGANSSCTLNYTTTTGEDPGVQAETSAGQSDSFVLTYDSAGAFHSFEIWGDVQDEAVEALACFPDGAVFFAGTVTGYDAAPTYLNDETLYGHQDIFLKQVLPASE